MIAALLRLFRPAPVCSLSLSLRQHPSGTLTAACGCGHPFAARDYRSIGSAFSAHLEYRGCI
jgi:hypothetical protein